jgi:dipeptidyl-peptidase-4
MDVTHPAFAFGAEAVLGTDATGEYVYHYASPQNPTQLYLYRTSLKRPGVTTRVTPADQAGNHSYSISPNGRYAVHSWSSFGSPPTIEIITLPDHRRIRVLQDNAQLRTKLATLEQGPRGHRQRRKARWVDAQTAGLRPVQEVSGAVLRVR